MANHRQPHGPTFEVPQMLVEKSPYELIDELRAQVVALTKRIEALEAKAAGQDKGDR